MANFETCIKCNNNYEFTDEFFKKDNNKKHGLRKVCKICDNKVRNIGKYKNKYGITLDEERLFETYTPIQWWEFMFTGTPNGKYLHRLPDDINNICNVKLICNYVLFSHLKIKDKSTITISLINKYKLGFVHKYTNSLSDILNLLFESIDLENNIEDSFEKTKIRIMLGQERYSNWTIKEIELLQNNQDKTIKELMMLLKNKSDSSIRSKIKSLGLSFLKEDINILFPRGYLSNITSEEEKVEHRKKIVAIKKYKEKGIHLDYEKMFSTYNCIEWYLFYENKLIYSFPQNHFTKNDDLEIIKFIIEQRLMIKTRDDILKIKFDDFKEYRIHQIVNKIGMYSALNQIYPFYNLKPYEMNHLLNGYLNDKDNVDEYMRFIIQIIINDNEIIDYKTEIPQYVNYTYLREIGHGRITDAINKYNIYKSFYHCLNELYPKWGLEPSDFRIFITKDKQFCNSLEEKKCFDFIYYNLGINSIKSTYMNVKVLDSLFYNIKYKERYIPDFIIKDINSVKLSKPLIIEYYGLYSDSGDSERTRNYRSKTFRKNEFYNNNEEIYFIGLYPEDICNNFLGIKHKFTSFLTNIRLESNKSA